MSPGHGSHGRRRRRAAQGITSRRVSAPGTVASARRQAVGRKSSADSLVVVALVVRLARWAAGRSLTALPRLQNRVRVTGWCPYPSGMELREERPGDREPVRDIHLRAFGDHGLVVADLVDALRQIIT